MRVKESKYASLPDAPTTRSEDIIDTLVVHLRRDNGRLHKIDLRFFVSGKNRRTQLARVCAEIFLRYTQDFSLQSKNSFLHCLRQFNDFLTWREDGSYLPPVISTFDLGASLLLEYQAYLGTVCDITEGTAYSYYAELARFFNLIILYHPEYVSPDFKTPPCRYKYKAYGPKKAPSKIISLSDLTLIADAALKDIEQIRNNHRRATRLLNSANTLKYDGQGRAKSLSTLTDTFHHLVKSRGINAPFAPIRTSLRRYGHPSPEELLGWYIPTTISHLVPFLVLLHIRTALNPMTLTKLRRNCLVEHPLPVGLTILRFSKARAGHRSNQEMCFPSNQPNGVVDLIEFLIAYTAPLARIASDSENDRLFIYRDGRLGARSADTGWAFANRPLKRFITRHNLPNFTFDQLRPSVATSLYLQTKDIFRIQRLLGHANVRTTVRYIKGIIVQEQHNKEIREGIEMMTEAVLSAGPRETDYQVFIGPVDEVVAGKIKSHELSEESGAKMIAGGLRTFLGRCKDPCNSPQPGEVRGRVCRSLHACIFCPNCWIFAEDLPSVISYRESLYAEKSGMTDAEWEAFHGEVVREINESILTAFPAESVRRAEEIARGLSNQGIPALR